MLFQSRITTYLCRRVKQNSCQLIGVLAKHSSSQLNICMPLIVPRVTVCLRDTKKEVAKAAKVALITCCGAINNPDIQVGGRGRMRVCSLMCVCVCLDDSFAIKRLRIFLKMTAKRYTCAQNMSVFFYFSLEFCCCGLPLTLNPSFTPTPFLPLYVLTNSRWCPQWCRPSKTRKSALKPWKTWCILHSCIR